MIRVHFEIPESHWMLIRLESDEQTFTLVTSSILFDSLLALAELPLSFAQWGEGRARVDDLPLVYEIVLRRKDDRAVLEVFTLADYNSLSESGTLEFELEDTERAILLAFWRGLRKLESRFNPAHWKSEFPAKAVERLGKIAKGTPA